MRIKRNLPGRTILKFVLVTILLATASLDADQMLLTLSVESNNVKWQEEFVLSLTIYDSPGQQPPQVSIDGLDQFLLRGSGKNLLQVPRGQTQKWIYTYTLTATEEGTYKLGPARTSANGRSYYSNFLFIHVGNPPAQEHPAAAQPEKKMEMKQETTKPAEKKISPAAQVPQKPQPPPPPATAPKKTETQKPGTLQSKEQAKPEKQEVKKEKEPEPKVREEPVTVPVVLSAAEVKEKIEILFDARKNHPYQSEGVPVVLKLISQLPVEDLRLVEDPQFAGFLKYDLPFTTRPRGEKIERKGSSYVSYDLLNFLVFPLEAGQITIPSVTCKMKVRVPSGKFRDADLIVDIEETSNSVPLQVRPVPAGAVVGDFKFRNEIVTESAQSKVLRLILEGKGQLSTFEFPIFAGPQFHARNLSASASATPQEDTLFSRKTQEVSITTTSNTTSIVLPEMKVLQFDPRSGKTSRLALPPLPLRFQPPGPQKRGTPSVPSLRDSVTGILLLLISALTILLIVKNVRPQRKQQVLRLTPLFRRKNLKLHISRSAARSLYQQISRRIIEEDDKESSLIETLKRHLPLEEWLKVERAFRALEFTAYSQSKTGILTYQEMKQICERVELSWHQ